LVVHAGQTGAADLEVGVGKLNDRRDRGWNCADNRNDAVVERICVPSEAGSQRGQGYGREDTAIGTGLEQGESIAGVKRFAKIDDIKRATIRNRGETADGIVGARFVESEKGSASE